MEFDPIVRIFPVSHREKNIVSHELLLMLDASLVCMLAKCNNVRVNLGSTLIAESTSRMFEFGGKQQEHIESNKPFVNSVAESFRWGCFDRPTESLLDVWRYHLWKQSCDETQHV